MNKKLIIVLGLSVLGAAISIQAFNEPKEEIEAPVTLTKAMVTSAEIPSSIQLAGENAPVQLFEVNEKLDRELQVNTYWQSNMLLYLKRAHKYFPVIEPILKEEGIPDDFKYLAVIESGLTQAVSPSGAKGFWQIMKSTGTEYGLTVNGNIDERYHIEKSTRAACQYLKQAHDKFGSWTLAAASYNMGMGGLNKQLKRQQVDNYYDLLLNSETGRYVYRILAVKTIMTNPEHYGFVVNEDDLWPIDEFNLIEVDTSVANLSDFALAQKINYKVLKNMNPWLREINLHNPHKKKYEIKVPTSSQLKKYIQ